MTTPGNTTAKTLDELQALAKSGDALMKQLLAELSGLSQDREEMEQLHRYASIARQATASLVVEAAFALRDAEGGGRRAVLQ